MYINKLLSILCALCVSMSLSAQTELYVATTGNDATGNGSIGAPYATIAKAAAIANNPTAAVTIWVRGGTYQNSSFTTTATLSESDYAPETAGEVIWKQTATDAVKLNNINGTSSAWITIKPYTGETVVIEGDADNSFTIRLCSYIQVEGFQIKGVKERIPKQLAWKYWGTYRYLSGGSYVYGDRKTDICTQYGISPCTDIPPNVFTTGTEYSSLPNIQSLNVERPNLFGGKGLLVTNSHHIKVVNNEIYNFPGGGLRITASDFVDATDNKVHDNSSRASVGTHGLVVEGLSEITGDNSVTTKVTLARNKIYSNYNEIYSWVQTKRLVTTAIDEGKGLALLRTSVAESGYHGIIRVENNIAYDNGKSGIHCNDVDKAQFYNNTVYNNGHTNIYDASVSGGSNGGISIQASNDIQIVNNIVVVTSGLSPALVALSEGNNSTGETVSNNLVYGGASDWASGFTTGDPLFMNVATGDVRLQSSSPAINQGTTTNAPTTDFSKTTRTGNPDIGAYEYGSPLPVQLLRFDGKATPKGNHLTWATVQETAFKAFELQRAKEDLDFKTLETITAKGSNSVYEYWDESQGLTYYRLKIKDLDGRLEYSKIIAIDVAEGFKLSIRPTFVTDRLTIEGANTYKVFNAVGQFILQSSDKFLDVSALPQGIYFLHAGQTIVKFVHY